MLKPQVTTKVLFNKRHWWAHAISHSLVMGYGCRIVFAFEPNDDDCCLIPSDHILLLVFMKCIACFLLLFSILSLFIVFFSLLFNIHTTFANYTVYVRSLILRFIGTTKIHSTFLLFFFLCNVCAFDVKTTPLPRCF